MPLRKKKRETDPTTERLIEQGIIKIKTDSGDEKKGAKQKIRDFGRVTYDFWSGVKYTLILSAFLWWLPLFGPMLAGYVGGRRTGGPKKGLAAAITALGVIGLIHMAFSYNLIPPSVIELLSMPSSILAAAYQRPMLAPYIRFLEMYWSSFFHTVLGGLPYSPNSYIITIIFAYIGGVISVEKTIEIKDANGNGSTINIDLSSTGQNPTPSTRYSDKKKMLVNSNFNYDPRRAENAHTSKRWEDLKPVKISQKRTKEDLKKKKQRDERMEDQDSPSQKHRYGPVKFSRRPVRHHTNTEGDDWEFL